MQPSDIQVISCPPGPPDTEVRWQLAAVSAPLTNSESGVIVLDWVVREGSCCRGRGAFDEARRQVGV